MTSRKVEDFGPYKVVTGKTAKGDPSGETLEGKVTRMVYENPSGRSTLEIYRNYREALEKAGTSFVYACELDACGPAFARSAWNRFNRLFAAADGDPRYFAGKLTAGGGTRSASRSRLPRSCCRRPFSSRSFRPTRRSRTG